MAWARRGTRRAGARHVVAGKLRKVRSLTGHQRTFLQAHAPGPVKITLPSPSQFPAISFYLGLSDLFYPTRSELLWDIAGIIKSEVPALLESGVDYIQIDAAPIQLLCRPRMPAALAGLGRRPGP